MHRTILATLTALFASLLVVDSAHAGALPALEWEAPLHSCIPADLVLDDAGQTYVACQDTATRALRVLSYAPDGALLAESTLTVAEGADSRPVDLAWAAGQLYVAITSQQQGASDAALYALATPGLTERWHRVHAGATASSLTTNEAGDVWLGAVAAGATTDLLIASYHASGVPGINVLYDSGEDDTLGGQKRSLAVDSGDNLYVAAGEALLRFDQHGALAWRAEQLSYAVVADAEGRAVVTTPREPEGQTARFTSDGRRDFLVMRGGSSVAVTPSGQAWIGGTRVTSDASGWDLLITLLDPDGHVLFTDRYDGGNQDRFVDLGVDSAGAAYVLASSYVRGGPFSFADRYLVLKYTAAERRVWTEKYGHGGLPKALGVTAEGRFVATGADGTASFAQGEAEECEGWWPGCWR